MTEKRRKTAQAKKTKASVVRTGTKRGVSEAGTVQDFGIRRQFIKTKNSWKVTFKLPKVAAPEAKTVCVVGEFNGWDQNANPMKKLKCGDFTATLELPPGKEYQFRYVIDQSVWENDWNADKYERGPYGIDNSVIIL
jgi:1,4-alpha-glucan branching enzyme